MAAAGSAAPSMSETFRHASFLGRLSTRYMSNSNMRMRREDTVKEANCCKFVNYTKSLTQSAKMAW
jgi:hypothetical protein